MEKTEPVIFAGGFNDEKLHSGFVGKVKSLNTLRGRMNEKAHIEEMFSLVKDPIGNAIPMASWEISSLKNGVPLQKCWWLVKTQAEKNLTELSVRYFHGINLYAWHQEEDSTLPSLAKELIGYPLYPSSGIEQSSSCAFRTETSTQPQNHQYQMGSPVLAQGDRQNTQGSN